MAEPAFVALGDRAIRFARPADLPPRAIVRAVRAWPGVVDVVVARYDVAAYLDRPGAIDPVRIAALSAPTPVRYAEAAARFAAAGLAFEKRPFGLEATVDEARLQIGGSHAGGDELSVARAGRVAWYVRPTLGELVDLIVEAGVLARTTGCALADALQEVDERRPPELVALDDTREIELAAVYDGADLADVARAAGLSVDEVRALHTGATYTVDTLGFAPGFAYLTGVDPRLDLPRRATPRPRVAAGAIGIAGGYTAVYPFDSPGGWHLLGRITGAAIEGVAVEPRLFGPDGGLLRLGDRVRFVERAPAAPRVVEAAPRDATPAAPGLAVVRAFGLVTIQDLGRPGRMHEGLAPGGALVPELLVAANRAAGNPDGAAGIEVLGKLTVRAEATLAIATDRGARTLAAGEELVVEGEPRRVAYLALRGGVDAPAILGGRGVQLSAGIGAPLRAGDRIAPGDAPAAPPRPAPVLDDAAPIRIVPGPDLAAFAPDALARLASAPYRVLPTSDRVGTRLEGPAIPRAPGRVDASRPMVRGAIEVPADGAPIVLGPEHPTTGGYPILAVIAQADLGRFFAVRLGGTVRFA